MHRGCRLAPEFRADFGRTVVTAFARIDGRPIGVVANQRHRCRSAAEKCRSAA